MEVLMVVKFPTRIKFSKENPIEDFYKKCTSGFEKKVRIELISVVAFSLNSKDYSRLKSLLNKHLKFNHPYLSSKRRNFEIKCDERTKSSLSGSFFSNSFI